MENGKFTPEQTYKRRLNNKFISYGLSAFLALSAADYSHSTRLHPYSKLIDPSAKSENEKKVPEPENQNYVDFILIKPEIFYEKAKKLIDKNQSFFKFPTYYMADSYFESFTLSLNRHTDKDDNKFFLKTDLGISADQAKKRPDLGYYTPARILKLQKIFANKGYATRQVENKDIVPKKQQILLAKKNQIYLLDLGYTKGESEKSKTLKKFPHTSGTSVETAVLDRVSLKSYPQVFYLESDKETLQGLYEKFKFTKNVKKFSKAAQEIINTLFKEANASPPKAAKLPY
jgi:hypothetical protein